MYTVRKPEHLWDDDKDRVEYTLNKLAELYDKGDNKVGNHELNLRHDQMGKGACFRAFACLFRYIEQPDSGVPISRCQETRDNLNILLTWMEHSLDTLIGYSPEEKSKSNLSFEVKLCYFAILSWGAAVQRGGEPRQLAESLPRKLSRLEIAMKAELAAIEEKKDLLAIDTKEDLCLVHIKKHGPKVPFELTEDDIILSRDFYEWGRVFLDVGVWKEARSYLTKYKLFVDRKDTDILDPSDDNHKFLLQEIDTEMKEVKEEEEIKKRKAEEEEKKKQDELDLLKRQEELMEKERQWQEELKLVKRQQEKNGTI